MSLVMAGSQVIGLGGGLLSSGFSFSSNFPTIQNPLGSPWINNNTSGFTKMQVTSAGLCCGTNTGSTYDDSYDYVNGTVGLTRYKLIGVVHRAASIPNDGLSREIEFHTMVNSETSSSIKLYETDIQYNTTGVPFVRWNGVSGDYTVASGSFNLNTLPANGDVLELDVNGTVHTLIQNSVNCGSIDVSTDANLIASGGAIYTSGGAGIGAFIRPGGPLHTDLGWQSIQIMSF